MKEVEQGTYEYNRLVGRIFEVFVGHIMLYEAWGYLSFSEKFDAEQEVRNKVFVLWAGAMIDTTEASQRFLPEIKKEAAELGLVSLVKNVDVVNRFCRLCTELIEQLTREEQIYLSDTRNQWVHSYFSNRHRPEIKVKYSQGGSVNVEKLSPQDYHSVLLGFGGRNLDEHLVRFMKLFFSGKPEYWITLKYIRKNNSQLYRTMLDGGVIEFPEGLPA